MGQFFRVGFLETLEQHGAVLYVLTPLTPAYRFCYLPVIVVEGPRRHGGAGLHDGL